MYELRADVAAAQNIPAIWQVHFRKRMSELQKIESELKNVKGAEAIKLHSRAEQLRKDLALLR